MKANGISYISIILSLIAISASCFLPKPIEIDYFNTIVAVLALLVTVLIGWQIFQIINVNEIRKEIQREKEKFDEGKNQMMAKLYFEIALTYYRREEKDGKVHWVYPFGYNIIKSAKFASFCADDEMLEWINAELEKYPVPMTGATSETEHRRKSALEGIGRKNIVKIRHYENLTPYFE